ncbi:MAG TPA: hypothetical protein VLZ54_04465 [Arenibacter sp.]|nr:hypothetical protein [Arenibacter sp.]
MSNLFSIALSVLILVQSSTLNLRDIVQLEDFLIHAQFHKEKYGDNLIEFISKHYGGQKEQHHLESQEEHKDHGELPLNHQCCTHSIVVFVLDRNNFTLPKSPQAIDTVGSFFYQESYYQKAISDIFQPPRLA